MPCSASFARRGSPNLRVGIDRSLLCVRGTARPPVRLAPVKRTARPAVYLHSLLDADIPLARRGRLPQVRRQAETRIDHLLVVPELVEQIRCAERNIEVLRFVPVRDTTVDQSTTSLIVLRAVGVVGNSTIVESVEARRDRTAQLLSVNRVLNAGARRPLGNRRLPPALIRFPLRITGRCRDQQIVDGLGFELYFEAFDPAADLVRVAPRHARDANAGRDIPGAGAPLVVRSAAA